MKNRFLIYILIFLFIASNNIFSQVQLRETVWLQLERELFLPGEKIFFRAVLLENDTYHPSVLSNSLRMELADSQGNIIKTINLELTDSELAGSIDIPQNLKTGWYFIRAYTNWMRNFEDTYFTSRAIKILNPGDANVQTSPERSMLNLDITPYTDPLNGKSMCSIHVTDSYGSGIEAHGFILSGPHDTVLYFNTGITGWTSSYYNAAHQDRYQAFAENYIKDSIKFTIRDTKIEENGPQISLSEKYGYLNIDIQKAEIGSEYKILIHRLYSWSWFNSGRSSGGQLVFRIPLKDIPAGISQVTILDQENNEIWRRLWSDYSESLSSIKIETEENNFTIGSEQSFNFLAPFNSAGKDSNRLSILVHTATPRQGIYNYLPGLPGWPALSEMPFPDDAFRAWLMSNSYKAGTAAAFFKNDPGYPSSPSFARDGDKEINYYPDTRSGTIRGRIYDGQGEPLALKDVAMTILNDNLFCAARTDETGFFTFTFPEMHGKKDFFLNYYNEYDPSWNLKIEEPFAEFNGVPDKGKVYFTAEEVKFLENQNLRLQLKNIYYERDSVNEQAVNDSKHGEYLYYGKPDFNIEVDEYIRLPNLREIFLEVVPFVAVRQREGRNRLFLTGNDLLTSNFPALVLLDGIPLYEYDDLLNLPPDRIKRIEGINDFYVHGNVVLSGIVNIISKNNDFAGLKLPGLSVISSIQLSDTIVANNFETIVTDKGYPRIDNVIIWDKLHSLSGNAVTVKLNDYPGEHVISIYGFDNEGRWYRGVKRFNVCDNPAGLSFF
ncbi:MAG: hypothetical protein ACQERS_14130 [Bacteroidota bacterium]